MIYSVRVRKRQTKTEDYNLADQILGAVDRGKLKQTFESKREASNFITMIHRACPGLYTLSIIQEED